MPAILKRAFAAITNRWKPLAGTFVAILLMLALAFALRKFPALRLPTALVAVSVFLIVLLWQFPKWQVRYVVGLDSKDRFDGENKARKTLSQILGGLILLVGFYFTWQNLVVTQENLRISSEGQITDRFSKAIAQLGEDKKLDVRLGGIYALERIANDPTAKLHWPIMEVLTAYVREHSQRSNTQNRPSLQKTAAPPPMPSPDIQAILTVIGRRSLTYQRGEDQQLDLKWTDLWDVNLARANLDGADLAAANLTGAKLVDATSEGLV